VLDRVYRILVVNPGSTSTKVAVYENQRPVLSEVARHPAEIIGQFGSIYEQRHFRKELVLQVLQDNQINLQSLDAVVGRGGNMKPVEGGTYRVNDRMLEHLRIGLMGQHASNLGGIVAAAIAEPLGLPAFVVDPVIVDEMDDLARVSGIPEIKRKAKDHPLNQKAVARKAAAELGGEYQDFNFLVVHMGGGISVGVHKKGRIVDVNDCLDGDGPFGPERSGGLPVGSLIDMCFSGKYTKEEVRKKIVGGGGLVAYLGTNDGREISRRIRNGDDNARLIYQAMAYQVAKEIGAGATVLKGDVDAIVLTGGLVYDDLLVGWIKERVSFLAQVFTYPGEFEMMALADGVLRALTGKEQAKVYNG
jgi:butyrate kinase